MCLYDYTMPGCILFYLVPVNIQINVKLFSQVKLPRHIRMILMRKWWLASRFSVIPNFQHSHPKMTPNLNKLKQKKMEKNGYPGKSKAEDCYWVVVTVKQQQRGCHGLEVVLVWRASLLGWMSHQASRWAEQNLQPASQPAPCLRQCSQEMGLTCVRNSVHLHSQFYFSIICWMPDQSWPLQGWVSLPT